MVKSKSSLLLFLASLLIIITVLISALSWSGRFDPLPVKEPLWRSKLESLSLSPGEAVYEWLVAEASEPDAVRLTARYGSGELDIGYGLLLGHEDSKVAIGVSPTGYAAVWQWNSAQDTIPPVQLVPWQPWPHVSPGDQLNEIEAVIDKGILVVYLNREKLWEGKVLENVGKVGIFGQSYGGRATVDFDQLEFLDY